jgi:DNA-binding response OmpR family regulator
MSSNNNKSEGAFSRWNILSLFGSQTKSQPAPAAPIGETARETVLPPDAPRILVVDDDAIVRKTTEMKLKAHGYAVTTAEDGSSAMHAARNERPDLILLDLGFPPEVSITWDGFGILNWLQRLDVTRDIPVIIFTGSDGTNLPQRANEAGAAGFFHKPLDFAPLLSLIESRLKSRSKENPSSAAGGDLSVAA